MSDLTLRDEFVCWSRMQAEAGQSLDCIVRRKELERRAGSGMFFWGVGNAPAAMTKTLSRAQVPVHVIFSIMKSKPKLEDSAPGRTVVWQKYVDAQGSERPLPPYAVVTSRGDARLGAKRFHYALVCQSAEPLEIKYGNRFDPGEFRNASLASGPVAASQVTALLRRTPKRGKGPVYEANLSAWLADGYWVKLVDPVELTTDKASLLLQASDLSTSEWLKLAQTVRGEPRPRPLAEDGMLQLLPAYG